MLKIFKYLFLVSLYRKAKKSFIVLFSSVLTLVLFSFIINDFIAISTGLSVYVLLFVKWLSIFLLLGLIGFSILKIFNIATTPFETEEVLSIDTKKDRILDKEKLFTQSDLIMQKYMKG